MAQGSRANEFLGAGDITKGLNTENTGRLARRLGSGDAVVIGLGSMLGAGVFAAIAPAAGAAGGAVLYALVLAGLVAYLNATSSAQLAAVYPAAGGTFVYGRERLGSFWGHLAGWSFVVGKTASCAAMALTFASYVYPAHPRPLALGAVLFVTIVNYFGVTRTAGVIRVTVAIVVFSLLVIVVASLSGGTLYVDALGESLADPSPIGVFQAAGLLFFAFAGYARIATLGEEVVDPGRTIPRAIPLALGITLVIYVAVTGAALLAIGPEGVARSQAPLADAVSSGRLSGLVFFARVGAAVASIGVLLSLLAGVSRTVLAMARDRRLPSVLAAVHPRFRVPHRAEITVGLGVGVLVATTDFYSSIAFSSFTVLLYYAITNAAAWTLRDAERRWPRPLAAAGFVGCFALAFTLPLAAILTGTCVVAVGAGVYWINILRT